MIKFIKQTLKNNPKKTILIFGLFIFATGIAMSLLLSNSWRDEDKKTVAENVGQCKASPEIKSALKKAKKGQMLTLAITDGTRSYSHVEFLDENKNNITIDKFSGKPLLINFWATWCGPCREEMPSIDRLASIYDKDEFEVITINLDTSKDGYEKAKDFLDDIGATNLTLYSDPTFKTFDDLRKQGVALGLPATILLDDKGCEVAVMQGPAEWDSDEAKEIIKTLVASY